MFNKTSETYETVVKTPGAFTGGSADTRGDFDGTANPTTLFTVTGDVIARVYAVCTEDLAGASATLSVGTTKSVAGLLALTTATDIDANELWHDATPDSNVEALTVAPERLIVNGADIIETVGTANITGGTVYYVCLWRPVTPNATVVAA